MANKKTNIFFVPYRPNAGSKKAPSENETAITQQKHAAREYHRKAKLERISKLNAASDRHARGGSVPASHSSSRPFPLRSRSSPAGEELTKSFAVFDVGTGELDPFKTFLPEGLPSYALDILDYATSSLSSNIALCIAHHPLTSDYLTSPTPATSAQWRVFSSTKNILGEGAIKSAVLASAMQSPAAFWSVIFAGATHDAYLHGTDTHSRNRTLRLSYKTQAIKELNHEIQSLRGGPASDELLLAIITLAAHGTGEQLKPPPADEQSLSALESVQNFQYYGSMKWEIAHLKAIAHLVYQKGGLHTVKMPGLANAIALADTFFAFQGLRPPTFPLLVPTTLIMSVWPQPSEPLSQPLQELGIGFDEFRELESFEPLMQIIDNLRLITIGFDQYINNHAEAPTLNRIVWARNFVTHDLLSFPQTPEATSQGPSQPYSTTTTTSINITSQPHALYNLIRLSVLTYTLLVLFPMPRTTGLHTKLSQQLMLALDECTVLDLWNTHAELLLWSTILGGIVSSHEVLNSWFVEVVRLAVRKIEGLRSTGLQTSRDDKQKRETKQASRRNSACSKTAPKEHECKSSWSTVQQICLRFLWFDGPECEGAGRTFWQKLYASNASCEESGSSASVS